MTKATSLLASIAFAAALACALVSCKRELPEDSEPVPAPSASVRAHVVDAENGSHLVEAYECNRCHEGTGHAPMQEAKHCVRCHQTILEGKFPSTQATPALIEKWKTSIVHLREVPSLAQVGKKFRRAWVAEFLQHPADLRPHLDESMPRFKMPADDAADIAAFLVATSDGDDPTDGSLVEAGRALFDAKGCATCHVFSGAGEVTPSPIPVPLSAAELARGAKFAPDLRFARERMNPSVVAAWIADPRAIDETSRMPNLGLSQDETKKLAAFVMKTPLTATEKKAIPARLPVLDRPVTYTEIETKILRNTCWHCHAEPGLALGDGGPGNSGGLGFPPRGLNLAEYDGLAQGIKLDDGKRHSILKGGPNGAPSMLVEALLARQVEESGSVVEGVRGMPLGLPALSPEDIQLVESWIAQGRKR